MNDDDSSEQILLLALQISRTKLQQFKEKTKTAQNTKMQRQPKKVEKKKKEFVHYLPYPTSQPLSLPQTPALAAQRHHFSLRPQ
jgi:uncharacterized membrane protein